MAVREAKSRMVWISSLGVMIITAFATLFGCGWMMTDAIRQHTRILGEERWPATYIVFFMLFAAVACLLLSVFLVWFWGKTLDYPPPHAWQHLWLGWRLEGLISNDDVISDDGIMQWLKAFDRPPSTGSVLP